MAGARLAALRGTRALRSSVSFALVATLCLSACGDDHDDDLVDRNLEDREEIVEVVSVGATSTDPAKCTALNTQAALEQQFGLAGVRAVAACEALAAEANATSVKVSNVSVHANRAKATVATTGGELDRQTFALRLVKDDGDWKMDRLTGFVSLNRDAWDVAVAEVLRELGSPSSAVDCVVSRLSAWSNERVQQVYIRNARDALKDMSQLIATCG